VAAAIQLVLREQQQQQQQKKNASENHGPPYYYYTRPCSRPDPIPFRQYLQDYRAAHALVWAILIPAWIVEYFVATLAGCFYAGQEYAVPGIVRFLAASIIGTRVFL
jgi:hypothetical protein